MDNNICVIPQIRVQKDKNNQVFSSNTDSTDKTDRANAFARTV